MRSLTIKYLKSTDMQPRATLTYALNIPEATFKKLWSWLQTGKPEIGRAKNKVTVNVIMEG